VTGDWDNQSEHGITRRDRWKQKLHLSRFIFFPKRVPSSCLTRGKI